MLPLIGCDAMLGHPKRLSLIGTQTSSQIRFSQSRQPKCFSLKAGALDLIVMILAQGYQEPTWSRAALAITPAAAEIDVMPGAWFSICTFGVDLRSRAATIQLASLLLVSVIVHALDESTACATASSGPASGRLQALSRSCCQTS